MNTVAQSHACTCISFEGNGRVFQPFLNLLLLAATLFKCLNFCGTVLVHRRGNSFMDFSVPEAVLKLRQGAGRLIRSKTDKGIIAILDGRLHSKFYGRTFLNSLPEAPSFFI